MEAKYRKALNYDGKLSKWSATLFYERAKKAYAVVITGETAKYGNIILKKRRYPSFLTIGRQTNLPCSTILTK